MLRIKVLHDQSQEQAARLEVQAQQLAEWNRKLEDRVDATRWRNWTALANSRGYFSPHLAELLVSPENQRLTESHRREITVVICDLRGFTAFAETTEPEEVMRVLDEYHKTVGPLIFRFEATLEHFTGDGLVAFFNDPMPCPDPAARALQMAIAMQEEMGKCIESWQPPRPHSGPRYRHRAGLCHPRANRLRGPAALWRGRHRLKSRLAPLRSSRQRPNPGRAKGGHGDRILGRDRAAGRAAAEGLP